MADVDAVVSRFLLLTCRRRAHAGEDTLLSLRLTSGLASSRVIGDEDTELVPVTTGSAAEFNVDPMWSCVGDVDVMYYYTTDLAIPAGHPAPTQLPPDFANRVQVFEIVDSGFPGFVFPRLVYLLKETDEKGRYGSETCSGRQFAFNYGFYDDMDLDVHGPAGTAEWFGKRKGRLSGSTLSSDSVHCMRCLEWPLQAVEWTRRRRVHGCPDSTTVERIVANGCDLVPIAHPQCKLDVKKDKFQWRLSFSRAEVTLLNGWTQAQQILYHMLRIFVKTEKLSGDGSGNTSALLENKLSNYNLKTLMLWTCEQKPESWWNEQSLIRNCVTLLNKLAGCLASVDCRHYFVCGCNLMIPHANSDRIRAIAFQLESITVMTLSNWFLDNYVRKCAELCPESVSQMLHAAGSTTQLERAVLAIAGWRASSMMSRDLYNSEVMAVGILERVSIESLTVRSCLLWMTELDKVAPCFSEYFRAVVCLHVVRGMQAGLSEEFLDVLFATYVQHTEAARLCWYKDQSAALSLTKAAVLMKAVATESKHATSELIEIELSKAHLHRALRCKDPDSKGSYCLANVYLAALYYATGKHQTAMDHCTLVTRSRQSQSDSRVVEGKLLPKVDDGIDNTLGLTVFWQYVRMAAMVNPTDQTQYVNLFTVKLLAQYLHARCRLALTKHDQVQPMLVSESQQYRKFFRQTREPLIADALLLRFLTLNLRFSPIATETTDTDRQRITERMHSAKLSHLLNRSAVDYLTAFRRIQRQDFGAVCAIVTTDFAALYAYKCGNYELCLRLCDANIKNLMSANRVTDVATYPEFLQLMDDDIVCLIGTVQMLKPRVMTDINCIAVSQLALSLYLMVQCQLKLRMSLVETLLLVRIARGIVADENSLDHLTLKLAGRKGFVAARLRGFS